MAGRPSKPVKVLQMEKRSHRTKKEIAQRTRGEASALSGKKMQENPDVKNDPEAHKEFLRISKLLDSIEKNDALYSEVINRYCLLKSECRKFTELKEFVHGQMEKLDGDSIEMDPGDYYKLQAELAKSLINYDRQIQQKRKMMFDIEKENIMTIAAALRSVPKQTEKKGNPLIEALNG